MLSSTTLVVSPAVVPSRPNLRSLQSERRPSFRTLSPDVPLKASSLLRIHRGYCCFRWFGPNGGLICREFLKTDEEKVLKEGGEEGEGASGSRGEGRDWTSSALLFFMWDGLMYYLFNLAPNQTPSWDFYFVQKLLNLRGDDGFRMNGILVPLWYILWVYGPWFIARFSSHVEEARRVAFLSGLSLFFHVVLVLMLCFTTFSYGDPKMASEFYGIKTDSWARSLDINRCMVVFLVGLGLIIHAAQAGGADWKEFYQYFRGSKFIHDTSLDFTLISVFALFWVYNDMTAWKWNEKGSWLVPLTSVPFLGPAL